MRFGASARSLRIGTFAVFCPGGPGVKRKKLQIAAGKMRFVYAGFRTKYIFDQLKFLPNLFS
jgi:hypothetical protein